LQSSDLHPKPIARDLYHRLKRASAQANRRRCSGKTLIAYYAGFGGLSIFHYDHQRNQTSIRKIRKFQLSTSLVKD
jgi:ssRNA-specific RNase YbeY (16S rRNA maturation enzyme)